MHILFLTDNFPPEVNAPASRTYEHCRRWVAEGHEVTVITCAPNFPFGRVFDGYRNKFWQSELIDGIRVIRVWSYIARNEGFLRRTLDYLSFMVTGFLAALMVRKPQIIIGTSPQFFTICAAYATSVIKRKPWIFEVRDLWPESIEAVGAIKNKRILRVLKWLEYYLYKRADTIITVTRSFKKQLVEGGINTDKIHVVTNGVDTAHFNQRPKDAELEVAMQLEGQFVAGYVGTHGMAHALDTILDAARILQAKKEAAGITFLLIGDGANRRSLQKRAKAEGIDNVRFVPAVPKDSVVRYWSLLDVSIIHLRRSKTFESVIPSKAFECMAMGLPILHGVEGESADIVTAVGCGVLFEPENPTDLADRILQLRADDAMRQDLSRRGLAGAGHYDRNSLALEMLAHLQNTAG